MTVNELMAQIKTEMSGDAKTDLHRLSEIAPTVPYKEIAYATTWREEVEVTAKALGKVTKLFVGYGVTGLADYSAATADLD